MMLSGKRRRGIQLKYMRMESDMTHGAIPLDPRRDRSHFSMPAGMVWREALWQLKIDLFYEEVGGQ